MKRYLAIILLFLATAGPPALSDAAEPHLDRTAGEELGAATQGLGSFDLSAREAALDVVLHHASYQLELTDEVEELLYWAASDRKPEIAEPARRMLAARHPETWTSKPQTPDATPPAEDPVKAFDALLAADRELRDLFAAARSAEPAVRDAATGRLVDLAVSQDGVLRQAVIAHLRSVAAEAELARATWARRVADGLAGDERALRGLHSGAVGSESEEPASR